MVGNNKKHRKEIKVSGGKLYEESCLEYDDLSLLLYFK